MVEAFAAMMFQVKKDFQCLQDLHRKREKAHKKELSEQGVLDLKK